MAHSLPIQALLNKVHQHTNLLNIAIEELAHEGVEIGLIRKMADPVKVTGRGFVDCSSLAVEVKLPDGEL